MGQKNSDNFVSKMIIAPLIKYSQTDLHHPLQRHSTCPNRDRSQHGHGSQMARVCQLRDMRVIWTNEHVCILNDFRVNNHPRICRFFLIGYSGVGLELCVETTYPEAEEVVLGVFSVVTQVYGALMVLITGRMIEMYGDKAGHACMIAFAAVGAMLATFGKLDLRRSKAAKVAGYTDVKCQRFESAIGHWNFLNN